MRQKGRTNLIWLARYILGYKDISREVHGKFVDCLQKFQGGRDWTHMKFIGGKQSPGTMKELIEGYEPLVPDFWNMENPYGMRRWLILMPRGHLKSTIMMSHWIQWIVNYPNIRILLSSGTGGQVGGFLKEIKQHFQFNDSFRYLYPEFCPSARNVKEFGNQEQFTVPNCRRANAKEPTVGTVSVGAVVASTHYDAIGNDDVVDKENVRTPEQILTVKNHLGMLWPLLETAPNSDKRVVGYQRGWWYLVGTPYDFCLEGNTPILMADWSHKAIKDVQPGDSVVGWTLESRNGKKVKRWLKPSRVIAAGKYPSKAVNEYRFASGRSVISTPEHKWWKGPWTSGGEYKSLGLEAANRGMKHVQELLVPLGKLETREAGWLAGFFDGEGSIRKNVGHPSGVVQITQSMHNPDLIQRTRDSLSSLEFDFNEQWFQPSKASYAKPHHKDRCVFGINGGWRERYRFLAQVAPFRSEKLSDTLYATMMTREDRLLEIKDVGRQDVYWFQTETGNYVANGYCSKNSDAYATVQDEEDKKEVRTYIVHKQSALLEGELSKEECKANCELPKPHPVFRHCKTLWPARLPAEGLLAIAEDPLQGWAVLSSQYLMNPIPDNAGLVESQDQIVWVPQKDMRGLYAYLNLHITVDLAGMEPSTNKLADNDFTVINLHGFGHDGTLFILSILRGRYTPFEVIDLLFNLFAIHPRVVDVKVEKEAHARVLLPFLKREMAKRQKWLPIVEIRRDNRTSKQQRIKGLQPWFRNGSIKFADGQASKLAIINEIMRFPKYAHDDILDTIADAMQNRDGGVNSDVLPQEKKYATNDPNKPINPDLKYLLDRIWGEGQEEQSVNVDSLTGW